MSTDDKSSPEGPLPGASEKLIGHFRGAAIEIAASKFPDFVFITISYLDTATVHDGHQDYLAKAVRRDFAHEVITFAFAQAGMEYLPENATWGPPQEIRDLHDGHYHPAVYDELPPGFAFLAKKRKALGSQS
jgi:hypothetical protein